MQKEIVKTDLQEDVNNLRKENEKLRRQLEHYQTKTNILEEENMLLRAFEEDYKAISEQNLVGIFITQDNRYIYVSNGFATITGYSVAGILNMTTDEMLGIIHPDDREMVDRITRQRNQEGNDNVYNTQFRLRKVDGTYIWLENWSRQINYRGRPASIVTYVDVTEKVESQRKVHESQELFYNLFHNSPTGLVFTNKSGQILEANNKIVELMGSPSAEATKQVNLFSFEPIVKCGFASLLQKTLDYGDHCSGTTFYESKWGKDLWINYHFDPIRDDKGSVAGALINFTDVTKQYKSQLALRESEEKLHKIFMSSPNAIAVLDRNGYIVNCNDRQVTVFGYDSKSEITGMHSSELISQDIYLELKRKIIATSSQGNSIPQHECKLKKKDGRTFHAEIRGGVILDEQLKPQHFIAVTQDVSQRKQYEKELVLAKNKAEESDRLKTAFLENMSHEIRTPLNGIIGFLDILSDEDVSKEEKTEFADIIHNCSSQLLSIINDILDVSKITSGQVQMNKTWVNITELMHEIATYYSSGTAVASDSKAELKVANKMQDRHSVVFTDAEKLRQILTNLINNARKFCKEGTIEIASQYTEDLGMVISVSDTGIGIPQDKQDIIFERFRQVDESISRQYGGTGLGLAISRSLVEMLGGIIWVDSQEGKGATFYFTLPYDADKVRELQTPSSTEIPILEDKRILVIDESKMAFDFLRIALRDSKAIFTLASVAEEINSLFERGHQYDLILADFELLMLHDRLGLECILVHAPDTPVVAFGPQDGNMHYLKVAHQNNLDWMSKPLDKTKVLSALKSHLVK